MRVVISVLLLVLTAAPAGAAVVVVDDASSPEAVVTYHVRSRGDVGRDLPAFRAIAAQTLGDARGWTGQGAVAFRAVDDEADMRLWLATPAEVAAADPVCSSDYSCRVGRDVLINLRRWRQGTTSYADRSLAEYRAYVINHEVGHWLGLPHEGCSGFGADAPVMLQQSKGLDGCDSRVWPLHREVRAALQAQGVTSHPREPNTDHRDQGPSGPEYTLPGAAAGGSSHTVL